MKKTAIAVSIGSLCVLLAACGGGGSGGGGAAAPSLNLNAAYAALLQNGDSVLYTLSGDCTGTSSQTALPAYASQNYETPAANVWAVDELQFDSLSTASQASAACTSVFKSNNSDVYTSFYNPTTQTIVNEGGSSYWKIYSEQSALPTTVTAGSSGILYKWKDYDGAASTAGGPVRTGAVTYSVTADTDSTLLVTITDTGTNVASGKLAYTYSKTYRLNANNTLTNLSFALNGIADSGLGATLSVSGTSTSAVTLNAQAAQIAWLNAAQANTYAVYDDNGNQCSPAMSISQSPLSSSGGTTPAPWNITYAKTGATTFSPQTFSGSGNCSNFNLPFFDNSYYDANYALVQQNTNNGSSTSINVNASSVPLPNAVKIGSTGQLYTFNRYYDSNTTTPGASGNVIYYVGALSPTKLALFEVTTKNYADSPYVARNILVNSLSENGAIAPVYGYLKDNGTFKLLPN